MKNYKIPVYKPFLNGNEKHYVEECIKSTWISSKGSFINRFETEFSKYINVNYATTVSNGTVALHLALLSVGIKPGDEIIIPSLTYVATANAVLYVGAVPVFVDSELGSWQIDVKELVKKITPKTKAIIAVHLYGFPCAMNELVKVCEDNNLVLIEDCAEAIGTKYRNQHVGTFGKVSTFSFFGNKTITTGEGGMVVTNDIDILAQVKKLKSQSVDPNKEYWHSEIGFNYRMTNICAAIGLAQLENIDEILRRKIEIANLYKEGLKNEPVTFQEEEPFIQHSYWMNTILLNEHIYRDSIRQFLANVGIETRPIFYPVNKMPHFNNNEIFKNTEEISASGINLPSYPGLSNDEIYFIIKNLYEALRKKY